jgi:tetratricopeptide (TPR) repeat protein
VNVTSYPAPQQRHDERDDEAQPWWRTFAAAALVFVVALVLFWPVVRPTKSWDDDMAIFANPLMLAKAPEALQRIWSAPLMDLYIPVTFTVWWALSRLAYERTFAGPQIDPHLFHAFNVLIHVGCALAVFALLRRLVKNDWAACAGALIFAIHPVQVEPVAWVSGTKDLLLGLFCVIALHQYARFATGTENRALHVAAAIVAFVAATLSKPTAVAFPLILIAVEVLALRRSWRAALVGAAPFVVLSIACALWTIRAQTSAAGAPPVALHLRPLVAADALAFYLYKLLVPVNLAIDYGRTPVVIDERGWIWWTWVALLVPAAILTVVKRRAPLVVCGALIFVAALLPVLGLKRFDFQFYSTVSDRYLYLPMLGIGLIVAALLARKPVALPWGAFIVVSLALIVFTHQQTKHWRSTTALHEHTLAVNPRSWSSANSLATLALVQQRFDEAQALAQRALEAGGDNWQVRLVLGQALERRRQLDGAIGHFQRAVQLRPDLLQPRVLLASALLQRGRIDEGVEQLEAALKINPNDPAARHLMQLVSANREQRVPSPATAPR